MSKLIKKSSQLKNSAKNSGFTLIELLVVIAIIGILSGILITTIDPVKQQNRSRNASIRAAISKAGHAVNVTKAATGSLPSSTELGQELENIYSLPTSCTSTSLLNCKFSVIIVAKFPMSSSDSYEQYVFDSHLGLLECGTGISYTGTTDLPVVTTPHTSSNCNQVAEK